MRAGRTGGGGALTTRYRGDVHCDAQVRMMHITLSLFADNGVPRLFVGECRHVR